MSSAGAAEVNAGAASQSAARPASATHAKPRSCAVCRSRKVRCDKQSPCSNCRKANIACVVPSDDRPPRWARRLDRDRLAAAAVAAAAGGAATVSEAAPAVAPAPGVQQVMERLRALESLVKEMSGQLEQANSAAANASMAMAAGGSSGMGSSPEATGDSQARAASVSNAASLQKHFGRMVLQDKKQARYISSGFWSRVNDEIDGLKLDTQELAGAEYDTESSDDDAVSGQTPSTQGFDRAPSETRSLFFGHGLGASASDLRQLRPLPSQIPFLVTIFTENVDCFFHLVHMPTLNKTIHDMRGDASKLSPANEALMFAIYYSAVASMEDEDVTTNFASPKAELCAKFRLGLEHSLARADFLSEPNMEVLQAFLIFLMLARRSESPRGIWMMTGLAIRMGQSLGLHRDGTHFANLTPYEVEMRRRLWWALCQLDIRASEDQGTEYTITSGSFDTKLPRSINDDDISPGSNVDPPEREGLTDMTLVLASYEIIQTNSRMMAPGPNNTPPTLEDQVEQLGILRDTMEKGHFRHMASANSAVYNLVGIVVRLVIAKMTLFVYLPILFSSPSSTSSSLSTEIRNKLLVCAIEIAEYNHALNADVQHRHWRWVYQTYTHWHAIVYLLIEIARRPWSPMVERAWVALHSKWLIPHQPDVDRNLRIWVPLRKLMAKARRHRQAELERIRADTTLVGQLEVEDSRMPVPGSFGPFPGERSVELFAGHWNRVIARSGDGKGRGESRKASGSPASNPANSAPPQASFSAGANNTSHSSPSSVPAEWSGGQSIGQGFTPWLWADSDSGPVADVFAGAEGDINMDIDTNMDWSSFFESAAAMELNIGSESADI